MQLAREAKTSDPLGRYYTESMIGQALVNSMDLSSPRTVLDLGAGSGSLVREAFKIWERSKFLTVDIDSRAESAHFPKTHGHRFKHHIADALDVSLADKLGLKWAQTDAAICNPPYLLPKWKNHFADIFEDAGLSHSIPKSGDISADLLFVAQNLRMLRSGGKLGLILPDGIVAGEKYMPFRRALVAMHCVEKVIELPRRAFKNTDAKAYIVVLSKNKPCNEFISVTKLQQNGRLTQAIEVPTANFSRRLDYSYLAGRRNFRGKTKIGDVAEAIYRGSYSSSEIKQSKNAIFHTTEFSKTSAFVPGQFYLPEPDISSFIGATARQGDILLARVGRNLSGKVCMVKKRGHVPISDCILTLRVGAAHREKVFNFLRGVRGQLCIDAVTKGVGARFLTVDAISEILF